MFKFLVGAKQISIMIYTALMAGQSPALESLVNRPMEEASGRILVFEDVEEETFARFARFIILGITILHYLLQ